MCQHIVWNKQMASFELELTKFSFLIQHLPWEVHKMWHVIEQIRKRYTIFSTNWLPDDDFIDVVEFVPVIITARENDKKETIL